MKLNLTVTRKVVIGYLVVILCGMIAVGYALFSLHEHNRRAEELVGVQFHGFTLLRDLRQNLLAQENLESQLVILQDRQILELLERRTGDLDTLLTNMNASTLPEYFSFLPTMLEDYVLRSRRLNQVFAENNWQQASAIAAAETAPLRSRLLESLNDLGPRHQDALNADLKQLSEESSEAYRLTLMITLIGILLTAPITLKVIGSIRRSVKTLQGATREIAAGNFETSIGIEGNDEFGQLARDFSRMARKLEELEQASLDANPLTRLPGNLAIERALEERIAQQRPFAHLYLDLDNFKVYNDHYGYNAGSNVINRVGALLRRIVDERGGDDDMVGHIGGDDYMILTSPQRAEDLAKSVITEFDRLVPEIYDAKDLQAGFIVGTDRFDIKRSFPLLTISIVITLSENLEHPSLSMISLNCASMKDHLKRLKGSNYLIDRRKQLS
jgi:GGDEF domain-containing protein/CHASE3 domain sensor protein